MDSRKMTWDELLDEWIRCRRELTTTKGKLVDLKEGYDELWELDKKNKDTIASQAEVINNLTNRCGKAWRENAELKILLREIGTYVVKPSSCDCDDCNNAYYEMVNKVKKMLEEK